MRGLVWKGGLCQEHPEDLWETQSPESTPTWRLVLVWVGLVTRTTVGWIMSS